MCGLSDLDGHFERKDRIGKTAFEWICAKFDSLGPYDILPMKTTIGFASGVNIAFLTTKKKGVDISIVLGGTVSSPRFSKEVPYSRTKTVYRLRINEVSELDEELSAWLIDAYKNGAR